MDIREGLVMDLLIKIKNKMIIILTFLILTLSHCAHKDMDFNPLTSLAKKILEVKIEK